MTHNLAQVAIDRLEEDLKIHLQKLRALLDNPLVASRISVVLAKLTKQTEIALSLGAKTTPVSLIEILPVVLLARMKYLELTLEKGKEQVDGTSNLPS